MMKILVLTFSLTLAASASASVDIEFLIDASGSMSAQVGGESQMEIAKKSIKQILPKIPPNTPVALRAYAHRIPKSNKEGSCKDTELLAPFQTSNVVVVAQKIDSLKPNGYTPIAYSLKATAQDFLGKETEHVIILLSDGEETCGGDPVQEAKNLLAQGFKVTIHTIGFRVDAKTKSQLVAIANATGGSYFDAKDAATLTQQLNTALQKVALLNKPAEEARGNEIRGGNQYRDAVLLKPSVEYRLDHHQKNGNFDYFYVDLKKDQFLKLAVMTQTKGLRAIPLNEAEETDNPVIVGRIMDPNFSQIGRAVINGGQHQRSESVVRAKQDGRFYILIGSDIGKPMHKESPFQIQIQAERGA